MWDFARDTGVRLHGGTDEDAAPTGITIGYLPVAGHKPARDCS